MFNFFSRKNSEYKIDSGDQIIYIRFFGETFSDDITRITKKLINNFELITGYNWICDISKSKQLFGLNEIESMAAIFKSNAELFQNIKMAFIIIKPLQYKGVNSLINFFKTNSINIKVKIVYDKKQAYDWILNNMV